MAEQPTLEEGLLREANRKTLERVHRRLQEIDAETTNLLARIGPLARNVIEARIEVERLLDIEPVARRIPNVRIEWEDPEPEEGE